MAYPCAEINSIPEKGSLDIRPTMSLRHTSTLQKILNTYQEVILKYMYTLQLIEVCK